MFNKERQVYGCKDKRHESTTEDSFAIGAADWLLSPRPYTTTYY